jgi:hypothetical protein
MPHKDQKEFKGFGGQTLENTGCIRRSVYIGKTLIYAFYIML